MAAEPRDPGAINVAWVLPLLSCAVISFQIALTRVFGYLFGFAWAPLAIAVALLGLGLGAWARQRLRHAGAETLLRLALPGLAITMGCTWIAVRFAPFGFALVAWTVAVTGLAGLLLAACYQARGAERAPTSYAFDLAGGAGGCLLTVPLLDGPGPFIVFGLVATLLALAGLGVARGARPGPRRLAIFGLLVCAFGLAWLLNGRAADPLLRSPLGLGRPLAQFRAGGGTVVDHGWSVAGRVDLYQPTPDAPSKLLFSDGENPTTLLRLPETASERASLKRLLQYLPLAIVRPPRLLVLGSGGGMEVTLARAAGAQAIDAVELNPAMVGLVRRWATYAGPAQSSDGGAGPALGHLRWTGL